MDPCIRLKKRGLKPLQEDGTVLKGTLCLEDNPRITFSERVKQFHFVLVYFYLEENTMLMKEII